MGVTIRKWKNFRKDHASPLELLSHNIRFSYANVIDRKLLGTLNQKEK